jgi:hypothetical protein
VRVRQEDVVQTHTGARDFDFLHGSWQITNERLKSRLTNSDEWEQFEALHDCEPILGGMGNIERFRASWHGMDFEGFSVRLFNPANGKWSIHWADNVTYALIPPMVGSFADGVGEFYGDEHHEGRTVLARFRWTEITENSVRWEQAFSDDQGETWETNWIMRFRRR